MSTAGLPQLVACQLNSQEDIEQNLDCVNRLLAQYRADATKTEPGHALLVVLPENVACFAANQQARTAERFEEIQQAFADMARRHDCWLIAGTVPCPFRPDGSRIADGRVRSACMAYDPSGKLIGRYDKIHLFDAQVADGTGGYQESRWFEPGDAVVSVATPFAQIGLQVCYDLRFPELSLALRAAGADVLTAPSAFTELTGRKHWELLLLARAADSQCYVIGAGQQGTHGQRKTWGHSAIAHPDGYLIGQTQTEGSSLITAWYDPTELEAIRLAMPLMAHRRLDVTSPVSAKDFTHG